MTPVCESVKQLLVGSSWVSPVPSAGICPVAGSAMTEFFDSAAAMVGVSDRVTAGAIQRVAEGRVADDSLFTEELS